MKRLLICVFVFFYACKSQPSYSSAPTISENNPDYEAKKQHFVDSVINRGKEMAADMDLSLNSICPISVIATLSNEEHNKKGFRIKITNTSKKTLDAIEIGIICYNNFDEQVQDGASGSSYVNVTYQEKISPGASRSANYSTFYFKEATKGKAFVKRIHFTDGSVWRK